MNKNLFNLLVSALLLACIGITLINLDFASADPNVYAYPYTLSATNVSDYGATLNSKISATQGTDSFMAYFKYYEAGTRNQIQQTYQVEHNEWDAVNGYVMHSQVVSGLKPNTTYYYWVEIGNKGQYFIGSTLSFTTTGGSYNPVTPNPVYPNPVYPTPNPVYPNPVQPVNPIIVAPLPTNPISANPVQPVNPIIVAPLPTNPISANPVQPVNPIIVAPLPTNPISANQPVQTQPTQPTNPISANQPVQTQPTTIVYNYAPLPTNSVSNNTTQVYQNPTQNTYNSNQLQVQTISADNITGTSAKLNGSLTNLGNQNFANVWFEFNDGQKTALLLIPVANAADGTTAQQAMYSTGNFSFTLNGLYPNRTYTFRAVAQNNSGIVFGQTMQFTTGQQTQSTIVIPPSNTSTGFENEISDFAYLGIFLSGLLLFIFRKHLVYVNDFAKNVAYATANNKTFSGLSDKLKSNYSEFVLSRKISK
jgi:hypothetical protein